MAKRPRAAKLKSKQAKRAAKNQDALAYEKELQAELGLKYCGYIQYPMEAVSYKMLQDRTRYKGEWNPDMPSMKTDEPQRHHLTFHLKPQFWAGGKTKGGLAEIVLTSEVTCFPRELYQRCKNMLQAIRLEHQEYQINGLSSYVRIRA